MGLEDRVAALLERFGPDGDILTKESFLDIATEKDAQEILTELILWFDLNEEDLNRYAIGSDVDR